MRTSLFSDWVSQVSGELAQKVMNEALKYQGWKYVYGGSNPNTSFDCSGLVQWCYGKAGISLKMCIRDRHTDAILYILDPKNSDLADLGTVMPNVYHTKEEMIECVNTFYEGMVRRSEEMKQHPNYKTAGFLSPYRYIGSGTSRQFPDSCFPAADIPSVLSLIHI